MRLNRLMSDRHRSALGSFSGRESRISGFTFLIIMGDVVISRGFSVTQPPSNCVEGACARTITPPTPINRKQACYLRSDSLFSRNLKTTSARGGILQRDREINSLLYFPRGLGVDLCPDLSLYKEKIAGRGYGGFGLGSRQRALSRLCVSLRGVNCTAPDIDLSMLPRASLLKLQDVACDKYNTRFHLKSGRISGSDPKNSLLKVSDRPIYKVCDGFP